MTPVEQLDTQNQREIARLLMEIAIRVAYIEQLNPAANVDETLASARQLVAALRVGQPKGLGAF